MTSPRCSASLSRNTLVPSYFFSTPYSHPTQKIPVVMTAIINDTTGTLIASSYVNPKTKIAVIFGTGCNAAYMEDVKNIDKIKNLGIDESAQMAINCEWVGDLVWV